MLELEVTCDDWDDSNADFGAVPLGNGEIWSVPEWKCLPL
jgi:hypothetical protein